jgi:uncharacterized protein
MKREGKHLKIETKAGPVSGILDLPDKVVAALTLAHGAGAGMTHEFMVKLASALTLQGLAVLRFQFPYMESGKKRTDHASVATAAVASAVGELRKQVPGVPLFAAGKSFGARMTTTAAAEKLLSEVEGIICFGFPLHTAGEPETKRANHLASVPTRMLFLQGTRDALADLSLMRAVCKRLPHATLHVVEGADHGFAVLKRSGRTSKEVLEELALETLHFVQESHS